MVRIKQKKLEKEGIHANIFLLDETVEKKLVCYTYDCKNNNYTDFLNTVFDPQEKYPGFNKTWKQIRIWSGAWLEQNLSRIRKKELVQKLIPLTYLSNL